MATFILAGERLNEGEGKTGAVFYNSTSGVAFGPVFDSAEDAENFMSFLRVDPGLFHDWDSDPELSMAQGLYKLWIECGKPAKRPVVQLGEDFLHDRNEDHHAKDALHCICGGDWGPKGCEASGEDPWGMSCSLTEHCFPLFLGYNNNELLPVLKKHKVVVSKGMSADTEHSCFYAYFKTKEAGLAFLERLNKFLRENWHKAYPEG